MYPVIPAGDEPGLVRKVVRPGGSILPLALDYSSQGSRTPRSRAVASAASYPASA